LPAPTRCASNALADNHADAVVGHCFCQVTVNGICMVLKEIFGIERETDNETGEATSPDPDMFEEDNTECTFPTPVTVVCARARACVCVCVCVCVYSCVCVGVCVCAPSLTLPGLQVWSACRPLKTRWCYRADTCAFATLALKSSGFKRTNARSVVHRTTRCCRSESSSPKLKVSKW
jgi:hypothetical protein